MTKSVNVMQRVYFVQFLLPVTRAVFSLFTELIGVDGGASLFYYQLAPNRTAAK